MRKYYAYTPNRAANPQFPFTYISFDSKAERDEIVNTHKFGECGKFWVQPIYAKDIPSGVKVYGAEHFNF